MGLGLNIRQRLAKVRYRAGLERTRATEFLGREFVYPESSLIGTGIAQGKDLDATFRFLARELRTAGTELLVDVGANIGSTSLQLRAGDPKARILAFEPSKRFLPFLRKNLASAGHDDIEVLTCVLGESDAIVTLHNNSSTASVVSDSYDGHIPLGSQRVQMTSLDSVLADRGPVGLIKVDTDGFDFHVLRGATRTIERHKPVLFFELVPSLTPDAVPSIRWLQSLGYRTLHCFGQPDVYIGATGDAEEAVRWSETHADRHIDVLSAVDDPRWEPLIQKLSRR
jgi:FkbM family methyltransferase